MNIGRKWISVFFLGTVFLTGCDIGDSEPPKNANVSETPAKQRQSGVTAEDAAKKALKKGDKMPGFELKNAKGELVRSADLLKNKRLVLVFYRGGWCPYCNIYLKELRDNIDSIEKNGAALVAVSPEKPDNSLSTVQKNELEFQVLSDDQLTFSRKMGLVFDIDSETDRLYKKNGVDLVETNGTEKPELPIPATYIVNKDGQIEFAFVDPDYKKRFRPKDLLTELEKGK